MPLPPTRRFLPFWLHLAKGKGVPAPSGGKGIGLAWLVVCLLACAWPNQASAQRLKGLRVGVGAKDEDRARAAAKERAVFVFPNVNKVSFYNDPDELRTLQELRRKKNYRKLLRHLEDYVFSFGVMNFYRQPGMLWELGQLYQRQGQLQRAKNMYRLALKHTRVVRDSVYYRRVFDSLDAPEAVKYVPLKYYYELVDFRKSIDTLKPPHSVLTPLGSEINGSFEDYGAAVNRKEDTLYFTTRRSKKRATRMDNNPQFNEDIYFSWGQEGYWEDAAPVKELNSDDNEGSPCLSPDGSKIYFSRCFAPGGYGNCDIYVANRLPGNKWSQPRNLGPGVNGKAWDSQPSLSHTGDTLYFASDRLGGFGLSDLYMSVYRQGQWQPALNMGPVINTRGNEVSPFYHPRYRVLYFSSDKQLTNFGKFDIFKSYYRGNAWQEPANIGPLVNGAGAEYYFTIDYDSKKLYYARSEEATPDNLDLYSFPLPMEGQPLATTQLSGTLKDSAGVPLAGIVSVIDLDNGIEVAPRELRKDGTFDFDLIANNNYLLILQGDDFFRIEQLFKLKGDTTVNTVAQRISAQKISFAMLDFERDSYDILPGMTRDLDNVLNFLIDHPTYRMRIAGHTDLTGDSLANLKLSQNRADAIKNYLTKNDVVKPDRIVAVGYGSQQPIVPVEQTEQDRRTNRRVEFEIVYPDKQKKP